MSRKRRSVAEIVPTLNERERRLLAAAPDSNYLDAGVIAHRAGEREGGHPFSQFARRNLDLFDREIGSNSSWRYRLNSLGVAVLAAATDTTKTAPIVAHATEKPSHGDGD